MKGIVSTLHLKGEDACYFVSSLFEPSLEMLATLYADRLCVN